MLALADHLWQSTWLALLICVWMRAWRGGFATVRHGFLWFAAAKFLLPLALLYELGTWIGFPMPYSRDVPPRIVVDAIAATQPLVFPATYLPAGPGVPGLGVGLAAVWAAVALQLAARRVARWRETRAAVRTATPHECQCALETRLSTVVAVPTVVGAFSPVLLLPAGCEAALAPSQLAAVFAHAQEYARRHFGLKARLQGLVEVVFWFHPLVWWIGRALQRESHRACDESLIAAGYDACEYANGLFAVARLRAPPDVEWIRRGVRVATAAAPRPTGFCGAAVATAGALFVCWQPVIAGAIHDRLHRLEVLGADAAVLSQSRIFITPIAPGIGTRMRLTARDDGVLLHNISIKELIALSYGVSLYAVISNQMSSSTSAAADSWLYSPRYDVFVAGRLREPDYFDPYALRAPITRMLVERFGFEIYENGDCQAPCGRFPPVAPLE